MPDKKPSTPVKNPTVQATTTAAAKKAAAPAKSSTGQATTTTTAPAPVKKLAPNTDSPGPSATINKTPVKPVAAPRPNSSGKDGTGSSPKNPNYEPHLDLKKAGFRVPLFKPRDPPKKAGTQTLPRR